VLAVHVKVLVVDDDPELVDLLKYVLGRAGYAVVSAADGAQAMRVFAEERPHLVVLDVSLPVQSGLEVCRQIYAARPTPVIMLSANADEDTIVRALRLGADDYMTKPFSARQLIARIEAILRRTDTDESRVEQREVHAGDLVLDLELQVVRQGESQHTIRLSSLEFRLLHLLAANMGRVVSYARLIEYAWGYPEESSSSLLKTHVSNLRRKLGLSAGSAAIIKAISGHGYGMFANTGARRLSEARKRHAARASARALSVRRRTATVLG
jgi:DNA-binding response OmpR family regulator